MKDFDTDQTTRRAQRINPENRTFKVRGREFVLIAGHSPEAPDADALDEWNTIEDGMDNAVFAPIADRTMLRFLEPGQEARWREARDPKAEDPITGQDLVEITVWAIEQVLGRPLVRSVDSSNGSTPDPQESELPVHAGTHLTVGSPPAAGAD